LVHTISGVGGIGANRSRKNEIYVDIVEKLTVLFNAQGHVVNSSIDGSIQMKSFLAGNPELRLALNEDLVIGRDRGGAYGSVIFDDCNFHESVRLDEFEQTRTLHFTPPDGEFAVLNYRISVGDFRLPFKLFPTIELTPGSHRMEFTCTVVADLPETNNGLNVVIRIPVPRCTINATAELQQSAEMTLAGTGSAEYSAQEKRMVWTVKKVPGGSEMSLKMKITLDQPATPAHRREMGPLSMQFEVPMYNVSNLQVRYLRISETDKAYNPHRWVRYITSSTSYVYRIS
jgi:AP-4 complex subunit mu-1